MNLLSQNGSIRQRLMLSFMLTTGVALLLASAAYFSIEIYQMRDGMVENVSVLARLIGANTTASMLFDDVADAEKTLGTLEQHQRIMAAALYDENGETFASYLRQGESASSLPVQIESGHAFRKGSLDLYEPLTADGETLGTIFIRSDTKQLSRLMQSFVTIFLVATAASLAICYLGASLLRRRIATPIEELLRGSEGMAAGDLSKRVVARTGDELGSLADSFNAMTSSLAGLVGKVRGNTEAVASVSTSLQGTSDAMCADAKQQEVTVDETSAAIESIHASIQQVNTSVDTLSSTAEETSAASTEMDASIGEIASHMDGLSETIEVTTSSVVEMTTAIREIAGSADELNDSTDSTVAALGLLRDAVKEVEGNAVETRSLSERTATQADEGQRSVEKTIQGMQNIQRSFQGLEGIIDELAEKSGSIGEVVKVIESVVEQTNLLALNAAIISAQAGEHGRAFAVVADEVNSLAERTAGSTREISQLIQSVQDTVSNAVEATAEGNARVEAGVSLSKQAGEILRVIGESAKESSERVHQIVGATEVQARGIEKVDDSVSKVKSIAAQLDRGTHEQDSASLEIRTAMERMHDLAQRVSHSTQEQRQESGLISRSVEVVAERIKQILEATGEQRHQSDQIMQALQVFRKSTHEGLRRSEEMASSVQDLAEHSTALESEVGRFHI